MATTTLLDDFIAAAQRVGAQVQAFPSLEQAADYVAAQAGGALLLPAFPSAERHRLAECLAQAGCQVVSDELRRQAATAVAGLTGANFALADTGTVVLESTAEDRRLASTLPQRHFVLLDPGKILADGMAAVPWLRRFNELLPRNFLAYITGPSRTADIERVLTIGVHGPKELHILLVEEFSADLLEM